MWIILTIFFLLLVVSICSSTSRKNKETASLNRVQITDERSREADKMMQTVFFKNVKSVVLKRASSNNHILIDEGSIMRDHPDGAEVIVSYRTLGYQNLTFEQTVILGIALSKTGYFHYQITSYHTREGQPYHSFYLKTSDKLEKERQREYKKKYGKPTPLKPIY